MSEGKHPIDKLRDTKMISTLYSIFSRRFSWKFENRLNGLVRPLDGLTSPESIVFEPHMVDINHNEKSLSQLVS